MLLQCPSLLHPLGIQNRQIPRTKRAPIHAVGGAKAAIEEYGLSVCHHRGGGGYAENGGILTFPMTELIQWICGVHIVRSNDLLLEYI